MSQPLILGTHDYVSVRISPSCHGLLRRAKTRLREALRRAKRKARKEIQPKTKRN